MMKKIKVDKIYFSICLDRLDNTDLKRFVIVRSFCSIKLSFESPCHLPGFTITICQHVACLNLQITI